MTWKAIEQLISFALDQIFIIVILLLLEKKVAIIIVYFRYPGSDTPDKYLHSQNTWDEMFWFLYNLIHSNLNQPSNAFSSKSVIYFKSNANLLFSQHTFPTKLSYPIYSINYHFRIIEIYSYQVFTQCKKHILQTW